MKIIIDNQSSASPRKVLRILRDVLKGIMREGDFKEILAGGLRSIDFREDIRMDISGVGGDTLQVVMSDPTY